MIGKKERTNIGSRKRSRFNRSKKRRLKNSGKPELISFLRGKPLLKAYRNYIKVANDLRKFYLKKEMENSKARCLTVDKLMDINDKFGNTADMQLSLDVDSTFVKRKMIHILSDPFNRTGNFRNSTTTLRNEKLFAHDDLFTPQSNVSPGLNA